MLMAMATTTMMMVVVAVVGVANVKWIGAPALDIVQNAPEKLGFLPIYGFILKYQTIFESEKF